MICSPKGQSLYAPNIKYIQKRKRLIKLNKLCKIVYDCSKTAFSNFLVPGTFLCLMRIQFQILNGFSLLKTSTAHF